MFRQEVLTNQMPGLKKFAMKLTGSSSDADDLLQATLLRAIEKQHLFQEDTDLFKWTSKIMYNLFVSGYRRRVKFETQYDPEEYIQYEQVEASQEVKEELRQVSEAMEMLSENHRDILTMVCVLGMKYAEVSEVLGVPVGTVRSRLSRAREALQEVLGGGSDNGDMSYMPPLSEGHIEHHRRMAA